MLNVSKAFRRALANDQRDYIESVKITLADDTVLNLGNSDLWGGGFSIEDSVSTDNSFNALGSAIINKCTIVLNNIYDDFSDYDFTGAEIVCKVGLNVDNNGTTVQEIIKKGIFTVDETKYNGSIITITGIDNMWLFDQPYSDSTLTYPASADTVIRDACTNCGVTLGTLNFPNKDTVLAARPEDEAITFREVIAYVAQVCGCFCRCDVDGKLELKWFNQSAFETVTGYDGGEFDSASPYATGDNLDGGSFNPWNTGDVADGGALNDRSGIHVIGSLYSSDICTDDVVITGVSATYTAVIDDEEQTLTHLSGDTGYVINIENNPFITNSNVGTITNRLATQLVGLTFRKASVSHASDPSIEAGDVAIIGDSKGNIYNILVTRTNFTVGRSQVTVCGAETPARKSAARYSSQTKIYVETRNKLQKQKTTYDAALEALSQRIDNASGMFETQVPTTGGGVITYMHNLPDLEDSDIQIMISDVGVTVTANGTADNPTWYGLTVDGTLISSILYTVGVNADWINTGQLVVKDSNNNETFFVDCDTGTVRIVASSFSLSSGDTIKTVAQKVAGAYGESTTAAGTATKVVTSSNFELYTGATIKVLFSNANTASSAKLNVNSTGAKAIYCRGAALAATYYWSANSFVDFTYDGTHWVMEAEDQTETYKRLTNDSANEGIYLSNGHLYVNASYINTGTLSANYIYGGTLTLGGNNDINGSITIKNSSGTVIGTLNSSGLTLSSGRLSSSDGKVYFDLTNGEIVASKLTSLTESTNQTLIAEFGAINYPNAVSGRQGFRFYRANYPNDSGMWLCPLSDGGSYITSVGSLSLYGKSGSYLQLGVNNNFFLSAEDPNNSQNFAYISSNVTNSRVSVYQNFSCSGTKSRNVTTDDYGERFLYCYETPSPLFGDVGEGVINEDGKCYVMVDSIFAETVSLNQYQIFLQKYGDGDCWIAERNSIFFVVEGTPGLSFGWELKAKQSDFDQLRLEKNMDILSFGDITNYADELVSHILEIKNEREVVA